MAHIVHEKPRAALVQVLAEALARHWIGRGSDPALSGPGLGLPAGQTRACMPKPPERGEGRPADEVEQRRAAVDEQFDGDIAVEPQAEEDRERDSDRPERRIAPP